MINQRVNVLNEIGIIPLIYKGNMNKFNDLINKIIDSHPDYEEFITDYFIKNKKIYFQDGTYNYNLLPFDCRTNNSLESYNKYLKINLGNKNSLCWMNFINFIKQDIEKNTEKIISSGNINKRFTLKKSNNIENNKYLNNIINNNSKIIENNIIINNNPFITKIKWIKYNNYSCRYDSNIIYWLHI